MQLILQKKSLILSVVFFVFSCLVFIFLFKFINNNKEASQSAFEKWQTEDIRRNSAWSLANFITRIEPERALIETHFVKSSDVVPFLDTLERLAIEAGGEAEVVSVDIAKDNKSLGVELKASGSFVAIYKFMKLLENSQYDLEFTALDIQNQNTNAFADGDKGIRRWTADFHIKLLSFVN